MKTTIVSMALATTLAVAAGTAGAGFAARSGAHDVQRGAAVPAGDRWQRTDRRQGRTGADAVLRAPVVGQSLDQLQHLSQRWHGGARLPADLHWSRLAKGTEERAHGV